MNDCPRKLVLAVGKQVAFHPVDTVKFMQPVWMVRLVGGTLMFVGILLFFWNMLATWTGRHDRPAEAE